MPERVDGAPATPAANIDSVVDKYFNEGPPAEDTELEDTDVDGLDSDDEIGADDEDLDLDDQDSDDDDDTDSDEDEDLGLDDDDEDEDLEDDDEDLDLDEDEDEEPLESDDEELEADDEDDAEEIGQKLSKKQQEEIEANPALKKLKKLLQADYTRKTQSAAQTRKQMEADREAFAEAKADYDRFEARLKNPETAREFFVDLYLQSPEFVQQAIDLAQELHEDPEAREEYEEKRELARDKEEIQTEKQKAQLNAQKQRAAEVRSLIQRGVKQAKLDKYAAERVDERVVARITQNARKTGKPQISNEEVVEIIKDVRNIERKRLEQLGKVAKRRGTRSELRSKKEEIRRSKGRAVPQGGRGKPGAKKVKVPQGVDPTAFRVDQLLGTSGF